MQMDSVQVNCFAAEPPPTWDAWLSAAGVEGGICQSTYWARVLQRVDHSVPLFVTVSTAPESPSSPDLLLLCFHCRPWDRWHNGRPRQPLKNWVNGRGWLDWADGPAVLTRDAGTAQRALDALLGWVETRVRQGRLATVYGRCPRSGRFGGEEAVRALFQKHHFAAHHWATFLTDLEVTEDVLWRNLDAAARKCVRKAQNQGVRVVELTTWTDVLERFEKPYQAFELQAGRRPFPATVAQTMWEEDPLRQHVHYYVAVMPTGESLATLGMYTCNGIATEIASSLGPEAHNQKIPAQDLLHWELLLAAKRMGCHTFDLAGVNPAPQTPKEVGIRRFKEKWGGRYVEYNTFAREFGLRKLVSGVRRRVQALRNAIRRERSQA